MSTLSVPYGLARAVATVITAAVWWCILLVVGWLFSGGGKVEHVSPTLITNLTAMVYVLLPLFTAQGVLVGMRDGLLRQRFYLPGAPDDPHSRPDNPWRRGITYALRIGVLGASIGYVVAMRVRPDELTPGAFAWRLALFGAMLATVTAWLATGEPFLRETRVPPAMRRYEGSASSYLWWFYVWPQGLTNAAINGALAFALFPLAVPQPALLVPAEVVVGDTFITFVILTFIIVGGVRTHARVDAAWGIPPLAASSDDGLPAAFLPVFFLSVLFTVALGLGFWLSKTHGIDVSIWALFRGISFGVYSGWLAYRVARAALHLGPSPTEATSAASG